MNCIILSASIEEDWQPCHVVLKVMIYVSVFLIFAKYVLQMTKEFTINIGEIENFCDFSFQLTISITFKFRCLNHSHSQSMKSVTASH